MNNNERLASLSRQEAEDSAVKQFTQLYNEVDEKHLDMPKLELALRNTFYAGMSYKEAVMKKEREDIKSYINGVEDMRDAADDIYSDCENGKEFFDKIWDKGCELIDEFNS